MPLKSARDDSNRNFKELSGGAVVYSLRHSFASHLFDRGLSVNDIKIVTGHTNTTMASHYTQAQLSTIKKALNSLI